MLPIERTCLAIGQGGLSCILMKVVRVDLTITEEIQRRPRVKPGIRIYAIGDVHGCYQEMCSLLQRIEADHFARPAADCIVIFLGDIVNRGPASRDVIRHLRDRPVDFGHQIILRGNHEEVVLRALGGDPKTIPDWLRYGGAAFVRSYGIDPESLNLRNTKLLEATIRSRVPSEDLGFLHTFVDSVRFGDYVFVHAGIRPGISLSAQSGADLRWIREEFLDSPSDFGAVIVHGHTISPEVTLRPNRIGVDTGAYMSGILSAVRLEGDEVAVLSAGVPRKASRTA